MPLSKLWPRPRYPARHVDRAIKRRKRPSFLKGKRRANPRDKASAKAKNVLWLCLPKEELRRGICYSLPGAKQG